MTSQLVRFFNILLAGLMAGSVFVIWIGYNPSGFSFETYVEQQQNSIQALNTLMPAMGFITLLLTVISAYLQRSNRTVRNTLMIAAVFMVGSAVTTLFGNQPINAIVMTWDPTNAPSDWASLRDQWRSYHLIRTITTVIGFALVALATVRE